MFQSKLAPLVIALQLLTRLPIKLHVDYSEKNRAQSLLYYPWVGLLIGGILAIVSYVLLMPETQLSVGVKSALILILWCFVTGFIHLDGLADSADAWVGGFGDRARTLLIMKDPVSGPIAVSLLVIVLLLKFELINMLLAQESLWPLIFAPMFARMAMIPLFMSTPYARTTGLAQGLGSQLSIAGVGLSIGLTLALGAYVLGWNSLKALIVGAMVLYVLRIQMLKRLGGTTGDTAGASIELLEVTILLTLVGS